MRPKIFKRKLAFKSWLEAKSCQLPLAEYAEEPKQINALTHSHHVRVISERVAEAGPEGVDGPATE